MKPGIYAGITNAEYHGGDAVSKSGLDLIARSPLHYRYATDHRDEREPTDAQRIGTAAHTAILEPEVFAKEYCLALRRQDVPDAIDDREVLVEMVQKLNRERIEAHPNAVRDTEQLQAMVAELNKDRQPKLSTGGSKAELVERIEAECYFPDLAKLDPKPADMKVGELKAVIAAENERRPGLLSTSGTRQQLADLLRENGTDVQLWSEICAAHEAETGRPYTLPASGSRHEMAAWLNANGVEVKLWSDVQQEWQENNGHRTILSEQEYAHVIGMRDAVMAHPMAGRMFRAQGAAELSVYWHDVASGVDCRCRPDYWAQQARTIVDLKTTDDASPEAFARSIAKWRYHVQAAMYVDGCRSAIEQSASDVPVPTTFAFVAVEKKPPYAVAVYVLDDESDDLGRWLYRRDLKAFAQCQANDDWPAYSDAACSLSLPAWELTKHNREA